MIVLILVYINLAIGFCCAIWFAFFKVGKIDEGAANTSVWFKLMIVPAVILLWPLVLTITWSRKEKAIQSHKK